MMKTVYRRLRRTSGDELAFRSAAYARNATGRVRHQVAPPSWRIERLHAVLTPGPLDPARDAAARGDAALAHRVLADHLLARSSRWPLAASARAQTADSIGRGFSDAPRHAAMRADAIVDGRIDLLGYRALEVGRTPDWHLDPVHRRRAPRGFWTTVPYLAPENGDHKIIWELNRHQYFLALGRAWWLTDDPRYRDLAIDHVHSWLAANPPMDGANWASMLELAFRCISWTYAAEFFAASDSRPWLGAMLVALDRQLTHIAQNLSRYFSPNTHLSGEALALYVVSRAFPELRRSRERADTGLKILLEEATRQVNGDGGHAELSPHYHRYSTDFYLFAAMVARASGDPEAAALEAAARRQAAFLRTIADDAGRLPLIGDNDGGEMFPFTGSESADARGTLGAAAAVLEDPALALAPSEQGAWIAGRWWRPAPPTPAPWPSRIFEETGYLVARTPGGDHLVFDAGPHGFLNGGHAHGDALSVTLTIERTPLLVDPGTATYTMDPEARDRFRSVRMHNAAVVDGREHAVPRGPFHWQTVANGSLVAASIMPGADFAQATHDACGNAQHVRSVLVLHDVGVLIVDHLAGAGDHEIETWWHLHPEWTALPEPAGIRLTHASGRALTLACTADDVSVLTDHPLAAFSPDYGRVVDATTICARARAVAPFAVGTFVPLGTAARTRVTLEPLPVVRAAPAGFHGTAWRITLGNRPLAALVAVAGEARPWEPAVWGCEAATTDARCAAVSLEDGRVLAAIGGTRVDLPSMASAVHG